MLEKAGFFITLEGGEGAGKSAAIAELVSNFSTNFSDVPVLRTFEPGSSSIGEQIRKILLYSDSPVSPQTEALLFAAERAQHMHELVLPHLGEGGVVISDRFVDSSIAYQGVGRGLDPMRILKLSEFATQERMPDLTVLLDIDPEIGLLRKHNQRELNSMEDEPIDFHRRVREAFLDIARESYRHVIVDASLSIEEVNREVWKAVRSRFRNER